MVTLNTCYTLQFYTGLEADTKPLGVPNGSMFLEMDTGKLYRFDEENQTWLDQANPTPSGGTIMIVKFTLGETVTADKTLAEILEAFGNDEIIIGVLDNQQILYPHIIEDTPDVTFASLTTINQVDTYVTAAMLMLTGTVEDDADTWSASEHTYNLEIHSLG